MRTRLIQAGGVAGMAGGTLYVVRGVLTAPNQGRFDDSNSLVDYAGNAALAVAMLLTLVALVGLHAHQAGSYRRLGALGFIGTFIGVFLMLVSLPLFVAPGSNNSSVGPLGLFCLTVGQMTLGVAIRRARTLPQWAGLTLIVGLAALLALRGNGSWIVFGLSWAAVGYALWSGPKLSSVVSPVSAAKAHDEPASPWGKGEASE